MHPIFSSARTLGLALAFWGLVAALICAVLAALAPPSSSSQAHLLGFDTALFAWPWYAVLLFFCLPSYAIAERLPWRGQALWQAVAAQVSAALIALSFWWFCGVLWFKLVQASGWFVTEAPPSPSRAHLLLALTVYCVSSMWHWLYIQLQQNNDQHQGDLQQRLLVSEVELQAIKATLHPHFLYNSLNMLADLALVAPQKVRGLCIQLADFLRYSLRFAERAEVSFEDELMHIDNYLKIEKERCAERLQLEWQIAEASRSCRVFPLLLLPLVENAVKHGIGSAIEPGFIRLRADVVDKRLVLELRNSFDPLGAPVKGTGHGLSSLRKRLEHHYGRAAVFSAGAETREFYVSISVPAEAIKVD